MQGTRKSYACRIDCGMGLILKYGFGKKQRDIQGRVELNNQIDVFEYEKCSDRGWQKSKHSERLIIALL